MGFKVGELVYIKDQFSAYIVISKAPKNADGSYASFTSKQLTKA